MSRRLRGAAGTPVVFLLTSSHNNLQHSFYHHANNFFRTVQNIASSYFCAPKDLELFFLFFFSAGLKYTAKPPEQSERGVATATADPTSESPLTIYILPHMTATQKRHRSHLSKSVSRRAVSAVQKYF